MIKFKTVIIGAASLAGLGFFEMFRELQTFRVRRYNVKVPERIGWKQPETEPTEINQVKQKNRAKLLFLTDMHGKKYGKDNARLLNAVKEEKPDVILVGGDMLVRGDSHMDESAIHIMEQLTRIAPVYCANGNHEQKLREDTLKYGKRYQHYMQCLKAAGVILLENETVNLDVGDLPVTITGLEIPLDCYQLFREIPPTMAEMEARIGKSDSDRYQILLAHNPVYMKRYKEWGANLTLSGHLHGGVIRLPFIGGVVTPQMRLFPQYSGDMYRDEEHCGIVSRGLGTHTVNVRLFNMAELVAITLES